MIILQKCNGQLKYKSHIKLSVLCGPNLASFAFKKMFILKRKGRKGKSANDAKEERINYNSTTAN